MTDVPVAGPAEVERALATAHAARAACAALPTGRRVEILLAVAARLRADAAAFAELIVAEAGKPIDLAEGEAARAAATFEAAALAAGALTGELRPLDFAPGYAAREALVRRVPAGVVTAIAPFNFPLNLVAHKVAPAVLAGCPAIVKPSPATPRTAAALVRAVIEAGWPAEGLHLVHVADDAHAAPLVTDPRVRVLTFTGSAEVGWRLRDLARGKAVGLELGGDACAIVHEDADVAHAARRCAFGGYAYAGQVCISVQHVFVHRARYDEFRAEFLRAVDAVPTGDPRRRGVLVGPLLRDRDADRVTAWVAEAVASGATVVRDAGRDGRLVGAKVLEGVPPGAKLATEEVFGPVVDLAPYDDLGEAVARANASRYGLQAGVFARDHAVVKRLFRELETGGIVVDDAPTLRFDAMPYGGPKASGLGREGPAYALDLMTERRTLVW
jgi:acyl-CoA reductase-like NAD-dependent aldehyde dehydrogenase